MPTLAEVSPSTVRAMTFFPLRDTPIAVRACSPSSLTAGLTAPSLTSWPAPLRASCTGVDSPTATSTDSPTVSAATTSAPASRPSSTCPPGGIAGAPAPVATAVTTVPTTVARATFGDMPPGPPTGRSRLAAPQSGV